MALPIPTNDNSILTFDSDAEAIRVLRIEGKRLMQSAKKIWRLYITSYRPMEYKRTGNSLKSIKLGSIKKLDNDEWAIELTFVNDLAYHDSVVFKKGERKKGKSSHNQGHAIMLISQGWTTKGRFQEVERFGNYDGFDYLKKVKEDYLAGADKRLTLEIQWQGKDNFTRPKK